MRPTRRLQHMTEPVSRDLPDDLPDDLSAISEEASARTALVPAAPQGAVSMRCWPNCSRSTRVRACPNGSSPAMRAWTAQVVRGA